MAELPVALRAAFRRAQELGFLGDPPLESQVAHALGFAGSARAAGFSAAPHLLVDLGSGGGIPGLVLAAQWPDSPAILVDANHRRCEALLAAVTALGWQERVQVIEGRAELVARQIDLRGRADLVVARSFGPPPVVAECGAPFLEVGGLLVVSEPPLAGDRPKFPAAGPASGHDGPEAEGADAPLRVGHPERWPEGSLGTLGLVPVSYVADGAGYQVLRQVSLCPDRFPRRVGVPGKRPLF